MKRIKEKSEKGIFYVDNAPKKVYFTWINPDKKSFLHKNKRKNHTLDEELLKKPQKKTIKPGTYLKKTYFTWRKKDSYKSHIQRGIIYFFTI